jgi:hypothetical protein
MNKTRNNDWGLYFAILIALIGVVCIFFPYDILDNCRIGKFVFKTLPYNELGDFVSGVTAPFLALSAFILLFLTYRTQRIELRENRMILEKQNETFKKQQFETTFFNMLNLHHQIVNSMDLVSIKTEKISGKKVKGHTTKGRDCFVIFYKGLNNFYTTTKTEEKSLSDVEIVNESYRLYYQKHQYDLGHYFRYLYHIIKFIDQSDIINKGNYSSLVRAQLSSHELLMLFYNGLSTYGQKFKPLIEAYHLLKNMPKDELLHKNHETYYDKTAYVKIVKS